MTRFCPNCDELREVSREHRVETHHVRGEPIEVEAEVVVCSVCREAISDPELDEQTLGKVYDIYRDRHGLLHPQDIKRIRERYGLSQRSLARLLGWGEVTIQRYENGALQDEAHDEMLRSLENPDLVRELLVRRRTKLPPRMRDLVERKLLESGEGRSERVVRDVERLVAVEGMSERNGFRSFDLDRLGQLVAWLAKTCPDMFKTKLAKLLWLVDFGHFRRQRISITGLAYARLPFGPVPDHFQILLGSLEEMGVVQLVERLAGPYSGEVIVSKQEYDLDGFSETERQTIRLVVERFGHLSATELSALSHKESIWEERDTSDIIPYTEADRVRMLDELVDPRGS